MVSMIYKLVLINRLKISNNNSAGRIGAPKCLLTTGEDPPKDRPHLFKEVCYE
jgi:hypothetical protein